LASKIEVKATVVLRYMWNGSFVKSCLHSTKQFHLMAKGKHKNPHHIISIYSSCNY